RLRNRGGVGRVRGSVHAPGAAGVPVRRSPGERRSSNLLGREPHPGTKNKRSTTL
ncbi:unnamed protein product, partial [Amoebophrya sp. A120]